VNLSNAACDPISYWPDGPAERMARHATRAILWQNNHLLFWMSLIPTTTDYPGGHPFPPDAVAAYGFVLAASAATFTLLRWHASATGSARWALKRVQTQVSGLALHVPWQQNLPATDMLASLSQ
jgi:uncharacterized membrane protein